MRSDYGSISRGVCALVLLAATAAGLGCASTKVEFMTGEPGMPTGQMVQEKVSADWNDKDAERGIMELELGNDEAAREAFERAVARSSGNHKAVFALGVIQEKQGNFQEAKELYERAYRLSDGKSDRYLKAYNRVRQTLGEDVPVLMTQEEE